MKKQLFSLVILAFMVSGIAAQTTWNVDKAHSNVKFSVSHMVVSEVEGSFRGFEGSLVAAKADLSDASVKFSVDVNSVNTDNERRDGHLKSDDFFNAEKFPTITFVSKSFTKLKDNKYKLVGNMTMRGVTRSVTLEVTYGGTITDPYKNTRAGFKITGKINRKDFGVNWSKAMETGGLVVGDDVEFTCRVELVKAK